jgi:hypothetical protein
MYLFETWKPVPSFPGLMASDMGRIKIKKWPTLGTWDKQKKRFKTYIRGKNVRVSNLICEAFHGPKPFPGAVVMHIDENAENNKPENLKWATQKENLNCPGFIAYCKSRTGDNSPYRKGARNGN